MSLNRGTYTYSAWVLAMGSNYSIGFKTQAGTWLNFNMADQIKALEWRKVKLTFTIYEPCVQFSLMNTFASGAAYVIVAAPMLEEGTNAGTQKPNELDLDESIGEGNVSVLLSNEAHVFAGTEEYAIATTLPVYIYAFRGSTPITLSVDDITIGNLPSGLTAQKYFDGVVFTVSSTPPLMVSPSGEVPITVTIDGQNYVRNFSYAISFKGATGITKDIRLEASTQIIRKLKNGTWNPSTPVTVTATAVNTTITTWEYSVNGGTFSTTPPIGVTRSGNVISINPNATIAYALYTIRASDGAISDTLSVIRLEDGEDGKDGTSTEWGYLLNNVASTPENPTGSLPSGGWSYTMGSISASNQYLWISSRIKPAGSTVWGAWSNAALHARWAKDGDIGLPGIPGQVPVQKEWVAGDRHRNSDEIVDYIYVRGSNSETSYWYQLIDKTDTEGIIAGVAPTGGAIPAGYKAVNWLKALAVKTLIAEEANLANLIFKDGKLLSIAGTTFAGEEIPYGQYTEYNFANTTSQPPVDSTSWTPLPSGTLKWVRYKKSTESNWTVKQIGTATGQWTMQFSAAPEGEAWYTDYSTNRFWARVLTGGEIDYGRPFKITTAGGYDFFPNVLIDGQSGEISGDRVTANNIRTKIRLVSSNNPTEIAAVLGNGFSVNLSASGTNPTDYAWYTITLPGDKELSGSILTIHAPTASVKRYKIKPSNPNALFYVNEPARVLKELQVVQGVRGTIEMKAVWDELNGTLDWHVLSRVGYMVNYVQPTVLRVPPYFKPDELVYRGACSSAVALTKKYQSIISNVTAVKESSGSAWARIEVAMPTYYGPTGSLLRRTAFNSSDVLRLEVTSVSGGRTVYVYPSYTSNSVWMFNVTLYNNSGTAVHEPFDFNIYTNDYFIQSEWMDNKLEDN